MVRRDVLALLGMIGLAVPAKMLIARPERTDGGLSLDELRAYRDAVEIELRLISPTSAQADALRGQLADYNVRIVRLLWADHPLTVHG